jgi:hypothetical protein
LAAGASDNIFQFFVGEFAALFHLLSRLNFPHKIYEDQSLLRILLPNLGWRRRVAAGSGKIRRGANSLGLNI